MGKHSNYVIQPRGKALYEDESSFGSRMLAKMGWSKGKGLGANEDGTQDFIRVRYKNDIGGLGFTARDDQWTENEMTFNALLKNLNDKNGEAVEDEEKVEKIKSLEEKSKKSRTRVHYQKFTRGKDLSRYSEKDLANIFGKKSLDESYKIEKEDDSNSGSGPELENVEDSKIINTGVSISDYFKSKRLKLQENNLKKEDDIKENGNESVDPENPPTKIIKSKKKRSSEINSQTSSEEIIKSDEDRIKVDNNLQEFVQEDVPEKKKKSKKSKNKEKHEEIVELNHLTPDNSTKVKKKKVKSEEENEEQNNNSSEKFAEHSKKGLKRQLSDNSKIASGDEQSKKQKIESEPFTSTTITIVSDPNKFFLDSVAVEKLKHLRLEKFKDSNVANIVGYGLSKDIKLEVCDSSIVKGISHVNKYSIYANVDKMHSRKYYKSLLLRFHKKRNTFKL